MITVEKSVQVNKPVAEVFAYVTNYDHVTRWQGGVEAVEPEGENAVGGNGRWPRIADCGLPWLNHSIEEVGKWSGNCGAAIFTIF